MNIRPYEEKDEPQVRDYMLSLNREDSGEIPLTPDKLSSFFTRVHNDSDINIFLAEENGHPLGYATISFSFSTEFDGEYVEIEELYIKPEFRNKGFGKEFINYLEQFAKERGVKSVFLVATSNNQKAQKLYENLGYKKLPRIEYIKSI